MKHIENISLTHKALIFAIIGVLLSFSCKKDWLDIKSDKKLTVPATLSDFQGLIDDVFVMNYNAINLGNISSDGYYVTDISFLNATIDYRKDAYVWEHSVQHLADNSSSDWYNEYRRILNCNVVLDGLKKIKPSDEEINQFNNVKGQALFIRARAFFCLAQIYASPYDPASSAQDLGIILKLSSDVTLPSKRSTVKETYDQIISDLLLAKELLPEKAAFLARPSKLAVYAFLSRVYLSMNNYDDAFSFSNQLLNSYSSLLDFNDVSASLTSLGLYNKEVIYHYTMRSYSFITSSCLIDPALFNLYDTNDLRCTRFFRKNSDNTISFKGNYDASNTPLFSGLAVDEQYLIRAECYARRGNKELAMADLNQLLKNRYERSNFTPFTATDENDALKKILIERKKELILRDVRWTDLRRLNKDPKFAVTLTRTVAGKTYTLEPNSYKYAFPIPDDIIQHSGVQQNPGW